MMPFSSADEEGPVLSRISSTRWVLLGEDRCDDMFVELKIVQPSVYTEVSISSKKRSPNQDRTVMK